jgi:chemotaxis protein MotB
MSTLQVQQVPRKKQASGGAPEWMVTFGDLMSILVCFFVLLISFSIQDTKKLQIVAGSMREAFGNTKERKLSGIIEADGNPIGTAARAVSPDLPQYRNDSEDTGVSTQQANAQALTAAAGLSDAERNDEFSLAAASIRQAWQEDPQLTPYQDNLIVQETREGLEIVISDRKGWRMFPEGSKYPLEHTRMALASIGPILANLGQPLRISGHTAAGVAYANPRYGAWELSSDRANVVRTQLEQFGLPLKSVEAVLGRADTEPFFPSDPYMEANERVQITVQKSAPPFPADFGY